MSRAVNLHRIMFRLKDELTQLAACHEASISGSFARDLSLGYEKGWNVDELRQTIAALVGLSKGRELNSVGMVAYERAITYMNDIATDSKNAVDGLRDLSEKLV